MKKIKNDLRNKNKKQISINYKNIKVALTFVIILSYNTVTHINASVKY